jgi:putative intracellular protease/amidase
MKRRSFIKSIIGGAAFANYISIAQAVENYEEVLATSRENSRMAHDKLANMPNLNMHGNEQIYMLMYPGFTALDLVGPQYMFSAMMGAEVHLVAKDASKPIETDTGFSIMPTISFEDIEKKPTVLFVPGSSYGVITAMKDNDTINFVKESANNSSYITSVCTGSMILGKAGLLEGKRATSHWTTIDILKDFGAIPVHERVVIDDNIVTGGGVTAGIDFGLTLLAELRGENYARTVQLSAEYAPAPPFNSGTPQSAPTELTAHMQAMYDPLIVQIKEIAKSKM